jgi:HEPN domain-containing protein
MTRWDLQELAEERMLDAEALLAAGRWSAAYYLAGYAVECAIKACIAKQFQEFEFPDKAKVLDSYSHDYLKLFRVAGLDVLEETRRRSAFKWSWGIVKDWNEATRYLLVGEDRAREMVTAINDSSNGILAWLRLHW